MLAQLVAREADDESKEKHSDTMSRRIQLVHILHVYPRNSVSRSGPTLGQKFVDAILYVCHWHDLSRRELPWLTTVNTLVTSAPALRLGTPGQCFSIGLLRVQ